MMKREREDDEEMKREDDEERERRMKREREDDEERGRDIMKGRMSVLSSELKLRGVRFKRGALLWS